MAAIKELLETLAGGGGTSKRIRTDPMQYRCFMFTMGFVAPLRLPDKHPSELYIAGSYSRINSRYPLRARARSLARERERMTRVDRSGGERRANYRAAKTREEKGGGSGVAFLREFLYRFSFSTRALIGPTRTQRRVLVATTRRATRKRTTAAEVGIERAGTLK